MRFFIIAAVVGGTGLLLRHEGTMPAVPAPQPVLLATQTLTGGPQGYRKLDRLAGRLGVAPGQRPDQDLYVISSSGKRYALVALIDALLDRMDAVETARANVAGPRRAKPSASSTPSRAWRRGS